MWQQLAENGSWAGELHDRRKDGSIYPKWLNIAVVRDADGNDHQLRRHLPGHHRAQGKRRTGRLPGQPRHADRPAQPPPAAGSPAERHHPVRGAAARPCLPAVPRSRQLQVGQRLARPRQRRQAADRRRHTAEGNRARIRHRGAARRRRIRGAADAIPTTTWKSPRSPARSSMPSRGRWTLPVTISTSPLRWASACIQTTATMRRHCSSMPTPRCMSPSRPATTSSVISTPA